MSELQDLINDLVIGNRILANEDVVDAYGHISVRHPRDPSKYLLSRAIAPSLVTADDILEFNLDGTPSGTREGKPYIERFMHGGIYEARPDVQCVIHSHAPDVLPFTVSSVKLRPTVHVAVDMGHEVPNWDIADKFGVTSLLVTNMDHARDLAKFLGPKPVALMRGHGYVATANNIRHAVQTAIYTRLNARVQYQATTLGGEVKYMSSAEIDAKLASAKTGGRDRHRAWDYWANRCGCGHMLGHGHQAEH
jgi:HCOMODA/2-hydroxy-3-carboxy-muconic semialdehyde decarboxylase